MDDLMITVIVFAGIVFFCFIMRIVLTVQEKKEEKQKKIKAAKDREERVQRIRNSYKSDSDQEIGINKIEAAKIPEKKEPELPEELPKEPVLFIVKGTFYRDNDAIERAEKLKPGEPLKLQKEPTNLNDSNAIKVLTEDGFFIGYVDRIYSEKFTEHYRYILSCNVEFLVEGELAPNIYVTIFFENHKDTLETYKVNWDRRRKMETLHHASAYAKAYPERGLEIALPLAEEGFYYAMFVCCQCYRTQKNYDEEEKMLESLIRLIETESEKEKLSSPFDWNKKGSVTYEKMLKRLGNVKKLNKSKK